MANLPANNSIFDPTGWVKQGNGNSTSDVYVDENGNTVIVEKGTGRVITTQTAQQRADFEGKDTVKGAVADLKNQLDQFNIVGTPGFGGDPALDKQRQESFDMLKNAATAFGGNYAADRANAGESRAIDLDTIARLRAAEEGKTPSVAEALMRKNIDQNANQALGLAATLGGSNPGMALRAGLQSQSEMGAKSAADIAALRAKEEEAARAMLAAQTAKGRAVDTAAAGQTGGQFAGIVSAPYEALTREKAAEDAKQASYVQTAGTVAAASSDIRNKKDVRPAPEMADAFLSSISPEERTRLQVAAKAREQGSPYVHMNDAADDFLSTLKPQSFQYKAPDGKNKKAGKRMGVMAQDLPAHDVVQGPDGKKWISADVIGDVLAGVGRLHDRVGQLEKGNIDLTNRPHVKNKDGSTSTVRSMGVNIDGQEVLIPTVSDDGRVMSDDEAVAQYKKTGRHLGKFANVADSNAYARQLHDQQADMIRNQPMIPREAVHDYLASLGIIAP